MGTCDNSFEGNLISLKKQPFNYSSTVYVEYILGDFVESQTVDEIVVLTQAEYDALSSPDPRTLYHIID